MPVNTEGTATFITDTLRPMITVSRDEALQRYLDFLHRSKELVGTGDTSELDWHVLFESAYQQPGGKETNDAIGVAAANTSIKIGKEQTLRLHGDGGSFITVSAQTGEILAVGHEPSPEVPESYGPPDKYVLDKLAAAAFAEAIFRQGAEWGITYRVLTDIHREHGLLARDKTLHIGMATLHLIPYSQDLAGTNRHALAHSATSGRILTPEAYDYIVNHNRPLAKRMFTKGRHPDNLAGELDTLASSVANDAAVNGVGPDTSIVTFPDPEHPDEKGVDYN